MKKKRIVIKIGSNLLIKGGNLLDSKFIRSIVSQSASLYREKNQIIIVTSGAVGSGLQKLGLRRKPGSVQEKQAAAAIGQPVLMHAYRENFDKFNITVSQLLLTRDDFSDRSRYLNLKNTILTLLGMGVIPIINENDTVSVEEIKFGDNDSLSALVALKVEADLLVILTDVGGLYSDDPKKNSHAQIIPLIETINQDIEKNAGKGAGSVYGTGGMFTKIQAAKMATASGVEVVICNGNEGKALVSAVNNENIGTRFLARKDALEAKKRWIAFGVKAKGKIFVDQGAVNALINNNKSLLPSGIISINGKFASGDAVCVSDEEGREIAKGLVCFSSEEIEKIKGKKTSQLKEITGKDCAGEVIHKDNLVILK